MTDLSNQPFTIFRFTNDDVAKIATTPDDPHTHDFEELIVCVEGTLEHFIDFKVTKYEAPLVSFVTKGKVHRVLPGIKDGKCDMWVLRFKSEFIADTTFQLYINYHDYANIPLKEDSCFQRLVSVCEIIYGEMQQPVPDFGIVRNLLDALFAMIESERKKLGPDKQILKTQNITFKNFLRILEENFRRPEGVEFYAEKLFMSARNLNLICQSILHQTVTETIETRKLIEAKNLLTHTDKTIAEIGFELGYNEKAYFTTVFKRKSGQTPSEFREEMRKLLKTS